jgi:hypothetical protein
MRRETAGRSLLIRGLPFEPRAVPSDLDSVLVDSGAAIERTWRRFAARYGLDAERVLAQSHGRRSVDLIRLVAPQLDAESEAARIEREEIASALKVRALPGARDLVESVPADRFAIVTSGSHPLAVARHCEAPMAAYRTCERCFRNHAATIIPALRGPPPASFSDAVYAVRGGGAAPPRPRCASEAGGASAG